MICAYLGITYAHRGCGSRECIGATRTRESVDYAEDLFALGAGNQEGYNIDSLLKTGEHTRDQRPSVMKCTGF